jgi:hypothetical protein
VALNELKTLISTTLASKIEEMKGSIIQRLLGQEDQITSKLRKMEGEEDKKAKQTAKKK